jgi:uncharacterized membrane protein
MAIKRFYWYSVNFVIIDIIKTLVIPFSRKTNILFHENEPYQSSITPIDCVKNVEVFLASKFLFHFNFEYIFSQFLMLLRLVRSVNFSLSSLCLGLSFKTPFFVWNFVRSVDSSKIVAH